MGIIPMNEVILRCENIHKAYDKGDGKQLEVLKGVSMSAEKNKITVIIGASGAGKSTLLHILGGLDKPDEGKVFINGEEISKFSDDKLSEYRNKNLGFVFQFHHLLPEFSSLENVSIPQMIGGASIKKAKKKSEELLTSVGLGDRMDHKPAELSGGEQQRVAVARALANNPFIIFADEPTGNLDSANSDALNKLFVDLKESLNSTLIIVTHNRDLMSLADKVYEMKDGQIITEV
jgi:lipoprotein-releasing system ATP-binding protein